MEDHLLLKICDELSSIRRLLEAEAGESGSWLSAEEVAARLGVSRDFIYAHKDELGGYSLSGGSRPRLRFDPKTVDAFIRSGPAQLPKMAETRSSRRSVELLPVKDD
jgi:hypothetical protein